jgi:hypothetical protein
MKPNLDKILNNEKKNLEKDALLKKSDTNNIFNKTYQKGLAIYEKLSKL